MRKSDPEASYLIGFLQADGHMSGDPEHKGKISVELSICDRDIYNILTRLIPEANHTRDRTRDTNFKTGYKSTVWTVCDQTIRQRLKSWGLPAGRKSTIIRCPVWVSRVDYYRGLIDGDGSVGFTGGGFPFISLVLSSTDLKTSYLGFLKSITGKQKTSRPNARDGVYNIMVVKEDAQQLARALYYPGCIALNRKHRVALRLLRWKRPPNMKRVSHKFWTADQDKIVRTCRVKDAMRLLKRSRASISSRKKRIL